MKLKNMLKLAQAIKESGALLNAEDDVYLLKWSFIPRLCDILKADNPLFQADKFKELVK